YCQSYFTEQQHRFAIIEILSGRQRKQQSSLGCLFQQSPFLFEAKWFDGDTKIADFFYQLKKQQRLFKKHSPISMLQQKKVLAENRLQFFINVYDFAQDLSLLSTQVKVDHHIPFPKHQIQFIIRLNKKQVELNLHYHNSQFEDAQLLQRMQWITSQLIDGVEQFSELKLLLSDDIQYFASEFNQTQHADQSFLTLTQQFEQQVSSTPDAIAVIHGNEKVDYQQLNQQINQLAHYLRSQGIQAEQRVGICLQRSIQWIVSVMAVLKTGGSYIPIDPDYPDNRIKTILETAEVALLISQSFHTFHYDGEVFQFDDQLKKCTSTQPTQNLEIVSQANTLAYLIFTSGSTGNPKGAMVEHQGITNLTNWYRHSLSMCSTDKTIIVSSIGFDLTQKNLFASLCSGAQLTLPEMTYFDVDSVLNTIEDQQISWLNCAPSLLYAVIEQINQRQKGNFQVLSSLKTVVLGGEVIHMKRLSDWVKHDTFNAEIINSYGPTECSDVATYHKIINPIAYFNKNIPLGSPIHNVQCYVLNGQLKPVPHGIPGELVIAGDGVGRGYFNNQDKTEEVFKTIDAQYLPSFSVNAQVRIYKTGDIVRFNKDGLLEFIGRADFQVKIRGVRIELAEIQHIIQQQSFIKTSVVTVHQDKIIAYLVITEDYNEDQLSIELMNNLPSVMLPSLLQVVDKIPLTTHGKVDLNKLSTLITGRQKRQIIAPTNATEITLCKQWCLLLGLDS
ncbi:MAG: amino acid adenylation domain-containing protein, partial [Methylococcales bacterium]|nr:amino acid adenylation domain-containing protein [Methylococcales bacterium]